MGKVTLKLLTDYGALFDKLPIPFVWKEDYDKENPIF